MLQGKSDAISRLIGSLCLKYAFEMSPGATLTVIRLWSFDSVEFELNIINVAPGTMGGRDEREIGSRALLAGAHGGMLGGSTNGQGRGHRVGGKSAGDNVKLE